MAKPTTVEPDAVGCCPPLLFLAHCCHTDFFSFVSASSSGPGGELKCEERCCNRVAIACSVFLSSHRMQRLFPFPSYHIRVHWIYSQNTLYIYYSKECRFFKGPTRDGQRKGNSKFTFYILVDICYFSIFTLSIEAVLLGMNK